MPRHPADAALEHASWLRALARRLVQDPELADELVQETWLRAVEKPPRSDGSLRGWLSRVLTNQARQHWRSDSRRQHHERAGARIGVADPTDDLHERFAVQRALMEAIGELDEKGREVVLLRFFDGLPPRVIAKRLELSVRTVETRLRRALERLRGRLDRAWGGERRAWVLALVSLADRRSASTLLMTGASLMGLKWIAGLAAVALVAVAGWNFRAPSRAVEVERPPDPLAALTDASEEVGSGATLDLSSGARSAVVERGSPASAPAAVALVVGRIVLPTGDPAAGARVRFVGGYSGDEGSGPTVSANAFGVFEFPRPEVGGRIVCDDDEYATIVFSRLFDGARFEPVVIAGLDRPLAGVTVDPNGRPIAGAAVMLELPDGLRARVGAVFENSDLQVFHAVSDAEGRWQLPERPLVDGAALVVRHSDYDDARLDPPQAATADLRLVLTPLESEAGVLDGVVVDDGGQPVAGAQVALGETIDTTDDSGEFHFRLDEIGRPDRLLAVAPGWLPVRVDGVPDGEGWAWPPFVEVRFRETPRAIVGRVVDQLGEGVAEARVWIEEPTLYGYTSGFPRHVEHALAETTRMWHTVTADGEGHFRMEGLMDRLYALRAVDAKSALFTESLQVRPGEEALLRFPAGMLAESLRGTVVDSAGQPTAGVRLHVTRVVFSATTLEGQTWVDNVRGASAVSDEKGRFELLDVPLRDVELVLGGEGIVAASLPLDLELDPAPLQLVVARECHLRIEVANADLLADQVSLLDRNGEPLRVTRIGGEYHYVEHVSPLVDGQQTVAVADTASSVAFLLDGEEVLRVPVRLTPGELNYLRP